MSDSPIQPLMPLVSDEYVTKEVWGNSYIPDVEAYVDVEIMEMTSALVMMLNLRDTYERQRQQDAATIAALQAENAALAELAALPAQGEALDFPDGPGWWAFEGHWTTAFPERAVIFHCVYDIYLMPDGIWYFQMDNDGHPVGELTGKWYRLHLPWDAPTPPEPPATN